MGDGVSLRVSVLLEQRSSTKLKAQESATC